MFTNPSARSWRHEGNVEPLIGEFHRQLPGYRPTPLVPLEAIARELGVKNVLVKDESSRLGLPAFKILGASWGTFCALTRKLELAWSVSLEELGRAASQENLTLYAATDGNHGRAVARIAKILGIDAHIYVPNNMDSSTRGFIAFEGASITTVDGDYDFAVHMAEAMSRTSSGILIQDTAWPGYEDIPNEIVRGYSTMLSEVDEQVHSISGKPPDLIICPVGVGSLAQAVVQHYRQRSPQIQSSSTAIVAVEPDAAACLTASLRNGKMTTIRTGETIMAGLNCGTVSSTAWPVLQHGLDGSITISDHASHHAVQELQAIGLSIGPCGAAPLAALRLISTDQAVRVQLGLSMTSSIVLLATEGSRSYRMPESLT